jgi:uncharacterized protein with HEPN domain
MQRDPNKYLFDIQQAAGLVAEFVRGKSFDDYARDALLRSGVERQFEIIGEALNQLARFHPEIAERIRDYRRIIAFRNVLIHGYADIDDRLVWGIIETRLPELRGDVNSLLGVSNG